MPCCTAPFGLRAVPPSPAASPPSRLSGFTLIELLIALAVLSVLLASAWSGFSEALERRRLAALSAEALALLQQARLEAQSRNQALRVAVHASDTGSTCLLLHTGAAGSCRCEPAAAPSSAADAALASGSVCEPGSQVLRRVTAPASQGVSLSQNVLSMRFDPSLGTTTPAGRVVLRSARGAVHHVVSVTGRVRRCAPPAGSAQAAVSIPGVAAC